MPSYTLQEIMSMATAMMGSTPGNFSQSQVSFFVNTAIMDVAKAVPHSMLESTTMLATSAGTQVVALPTDFYSPVNLSAISSADSFGNHNLREVSIQQIQNASEGTAQNRPNRYAIFGANLWLYPNPASADSLLMRYYAYPSELTNLTATPSLASEWRNAVLFKTAEYMAAVGLDAEREAFFRNRFLSITGATPIVTDLRYRSERSDRV